MGTFAKIAIGFALGLTAYHWMQEKSDQATTFTKVEHATREPAVASISEPKLKNIAEPAQALQQPPKVKPTQITSVALSEEEIKILEDQWNELPMLAQAQREQRGWRLTHVTPGSVFSSAGLKTGDLITTDFLENLRESPDYGHLAIKVEQILNRISR